jgi:hypothetical protein
MLLRHSRLIALTDQRARRPPFTRGSADFDAYFCNLNAARFLAAWKTPYCFPLTTIFHQIVGIAMITPSRHSAIVRYWAHIEGKAKTLGCLFIDLEDNPEFRHDTFNPVESALVHEKASAARLFTGIAQNGNTAMTFTIVAGIEYIRRHISTRFDCVDTVWFLSKIPWTGVVV